MWTNTNNSSIPFGFDGMLMSMNAVNASICSSGSNSTTTKKSSEMDLMMSMLMNPVLWQSNVVQQQLQQGLATPALTTPALGTPSPNSPSILSLAGISPAVSVEELLNFDSSSWMSVPPASAAPIEKDSDVSVDRLLAELTAATSFQESGDEDQVAASPNAMFQSSHAAVSTPAATSAATMSSPFVGVQMTPGAPPPSATFSQEDTYASQLLLEALSPLLCSPLFGESGESSTQVPGEPVDWSLILFEKAIATESAPVQSPPTMVNSAPAPAVPQFKKTLSNLSTPPSSPLDNVKRSGPVPGSSSSKVKRSAAVRPKPYSPTPVPPASLDAKGKKPSFVFDENVEIPHVGCGRNKKYLCPYAGCSLEATRRFNMVNHMRTHQKQRTRNHSCGTCGRSYLRVYELQRHQERHQHA